MKTTKEIRTHRGILLLALRNAGADAFLVNVILCHHPNPMRKLRTLLALVKSGIDVRVGQFDIDILVIDGVRQRWRILDVTPARAA